jgi:tetratricopeptide (TPR) repeat protein
MKLQGIILGLGVCVLLSLSIVDAGEKSCDELIRESDWLFTERKYDESDKVLDEVMKICPNLSEPFWRKGRNYCIRIEAIPRDKKPDEDILVERYRAIEALADRCIELDENNGSCWQWKGIAMGRRATTQGVLRSLWMGYELEQAWLKAVSLRPQYRSENGMFNSMGETHYALGMFYRMVPEWLCYFPLKQIFGICGDLEKSVEYQRKAVEFVPKRIDFHKELAVSLLCHGQKYDKPEEIEEAKKILRDIQALPEVIIWDKIDKEHARMLLEDPSLACGYQRDAQQELSKEVYEKNQ